MTKYMDKLIIYFTNLLQIRKKKNSNWECVQICHTFIYFCGHCTVLWFMVTGLKFNYVEGKAIFILQRELQLNILQVWRKLLKGHQGQDQGQQRQDICGFDVTPGMLGNEKLRVVLLPLWYLSSPSSSRTLVRIPPGAMLIGFLVHI